MGRVPFLLGLGALSCLCITGDGVGVRSSPLGSNPRLAALRRGGFLLQQGGVDAGVGAPPAGEDTVAKTPLLARVRQSVAETLWDARAPHACALIAMSAIGLVVWLYLGFAAYKLIWITNQYQQISLSDDSRKRVSLSDYPHGFQMTADWTKEMRLSLSEYQGTHSEVSMKDRIAYTWLHERSDTWALIGAIVMVMLLCVPFLLAAGAHMLTPVLKGFGWLITPDAAMGDALGATAAGASLCMLVIVALFTAVLRIIQEAFNGFIKQMKEGRAPLVERGHVVLVGVTDETIPHVQDLCSAYECEKGVVIAILSEIPKDEMEEKLRAAHLDLKGSKVVVRHGQAHRTKDLRMVSVESCKQIILLPDPMMDLEVRDTFVMQSLIALRSEGQPVKGRILAVCSLQWNRPLFEQIGGATADFVMLDSLVGKLLVQSSEKRGLGAFIGHTLGSKEAGFFIKRVPEYLVGKTCLEAAPHFPDAILIGTMPEDSSKKQSHVNASQCQLTFGTKRDNRLTAAADVMLLAKDEASTHAVHTLSGKASEELPPLPAASAPNPSGERAPEHVLILGWNEHIRVMLAELDQLVPPGTRVVVLASKPTATREVFLSAGERNYNWSRKNIAEVEHVVGAVGSSDWHQELPVPLGHCSRVFVLADEDAPSFAHADACTISTVQQIREILSQSGTPQHDIPIVSEVKAPLAGKCHKDAMASDFINTSRMPSQILSTMATKPLATKALIEAIQPGSANFAIRTIEQYLAPDETVPKSLNFHQARSLASRSGDVVLGWSRHSHSGFPDWDINPQDKNGARPWCSSDDRLVVLTSC